MKKRIIEIGFDGSKINGRKWPHLDFHEEEANGDEYYTNTTDNMANAAVWDCGGAITLTRQQTSRLKRRRGASGLSRVFRRLAKAIGWRRKFRGG